MVIVTIIVEEWVGNAWEEDARYTQRDDGEDFLTRARSYARALSLVKHSLARTRIEDVSGTLDLFEDGRLRVPE